MGNPAASQKPTRRQPAGCRRLSVTSHPASRFDRDGAGKYWLRFRVKYLGAATAAKTAGGAESLRSDADPRSLASSAAAADSSVETTSNARSSTTDGLQLSTLDAGDAGGTTSGVSTPTDATTSRG